MTREVPFRQSGLTLQKEEVGFLGPAEERDDAQARRFVYEAVDISHDGARALWN
jgi:hypothetical protein